MDLSWHDDPGGKPRCSWAQASQPPLGQLPMGQLPMGQSPIEASAAVTGPLARGAPQDACAPPFG